jgi:hypothetical protein
LLWLGIAALTVCAVWPAMWVAPLRSFGHIIREMIDNGGEPHASGNFFLGQAVADPGWGFYPVVVLLRSAPPTLLGLAALPPLWRSATRRPERRALLALMGFALLIGVAVSVAAKKFDRYLLPAWPAIEILAAVGLVALGRRAGALLRRGCLRRHIRAWLGPAAVLAVGAFLLASDLWYHPYEIAYYNPLLGGGATAEHVILVGWGEGMEQVGAWLRGRPDLERGPVLSWIPPTRRHCSHLCPTRSTCSTSASGRSRCGRPRPTTRCSTRAAPGARRRRRRRPTSGGCSRSTRSAATASSTRRSISFRVPTTPRRTRCSAMGWRCAATASGRRAARL